MPTAQLASSSDVLSFHCPLNDETRHMLCAHSLPTHGVYVVNAARGGVLDEAALLQGISDGRVSWNRTGDRLPSTPARSLSTLHPSHMSAPSLGGQLDACVAGGCWAPH